MDASVFSRLVIGGEHVTAAVIEHRTRVVIGAGGRRRGYPLVDTVRV